MIIEGIAVTVTIIVFIGTVVNGWLGFLVARVLKGIDHSQKVLADNQKELFEDQKKLNRRMTVIETEHKMNHG